MKLTKKQSILTGVAVAIIASLGSIALLAPQDVKYRALNLMPGHTDEAAPAVEEQVKPEALAPEVEVDNGTGKSVS